MHFGLRSSILRIGGRRRRPNGATEVGWRGLDHDVECPDHRLSCLGHAVVIDALFVHG